MLPLKASNMAGPAHLAALLVDQPLALLQLLVALVYCGCKAGIALQITGQVILPPLRSWTWCTTTLGLSLLSSRCQHVKSFYKGGSACRTALAAPCYPWLCQDTAVDCGGISHLCVLMCTEHPGLARQRQQLGQRPPHHLWRSLKQAPASQREERVACTTNQPAPDHCMHAPAPDTLTVPSQLLCPVHASPTSQHQAG